MERVLNMSQAKATRAHGGEQLECTGGYTDCQPPRNAAMASAVMLKQALSVHPGQSRSGNNHAGPRDCASGPRLDIEWRLRVTDIGDGGSWKHTPYQPKNSPKSLPLSATKGCKGLLAFAILTVDPSDSLVTDTGFSDVQRVPR